MTLLFVPKVEDDVDAKHIIWGGSIDTKAAGVQALLFSSHNLISRRSSMALGVLLLLCCATWVSATDYTVGDSSGWALNVDYSSWISGKSFVVGDKLVFKYSASQHNVETVNATAYNACSSSSPISTGNTGQTTITLDASGKHYFICGISNHCSQGMKLEVDVAESSSTSPSPPSSSTTNTTTPPSTTTTNNNSGAGSLSPVHATVAFMGLVVLKLGVF
ncbi:Plastocyanin-like domain [Musa troglodytarum]|uniref:Plastocyanin-like domain n=1 Tax=Musa troglodytarum TaxID=320322 RepID=A0A9E7L209_9LILI|nr:Plastocyanin-like domain [Musa troglodytarum]